MYCWDILCSGLSFSYIISDDTCNCSTFCTYPRSGSPHNVVHSSSIIIILIFILIFIFIIITSGNRTPGSKSYSDLLDALADSVCTHQLVVQSAARLRLVPINAHVTWWPRCSIDQVRASHGSQNEDKTLLQRSQHSHKGEFRHVSMSARQRSLRCGQNLRGPFLRATLPDRALERWRRTGRQ